MLITHLGRNTVVKVWAHDTHTEKSSRQYRAVWMLAGRQLNS